MKIKKDLKNEEIDKLWKSGKLGKEMLESEIKKRVGEEISVEKDARSKYYVIEVRIIESKGREMHSSETISLVSNRFGRPSMDICVGHRFLPTKTDRCEIAHDVWVCTIQAKTFKELIEKSREFIKKVPEIEKEYDKEEEIRVKEAGKDEYIEIFGICLFLLGITVGIPVLIGIVFGWVWVLLAIGLIEGPAMIIGSGILYLAGIAGLIYFLIRVFNHLLGGIPFPG